MLGCLDKGAWRAGHRDSLLTTEKRVTFLAIACYAICGESIGTTFPKPMRQSRKTVQERYSTGIEMETDSEVTSDVADGEDMGSLELEEEVLIAEETAPVVEGGL